MNQRQQDMLSQLEKHGEITIKALSETLGVTMMTIHRDLDLLEKENYLFKSAARQSISIRQTAQAPPFIWRKSAASRSTR